MDPLARYRSIIPDFDAFRAACREPLPKTVRVNPIKADVDRVLVALSEAGIGWRQRDWNRHILELDTPTPGNTWPAYLGWVQGQEEISAVPGTVLDPDPGDRIWDACAAPGGKTTHLAALQKDRGTVVANDDSLGRLSSLRFNTERLGVTSVVVTNRDAQTYSMDPFDFDRFDGTLVDAPCTCEGTVRKNPDVLDDWSLEHLQSLSGVQKGILRRAIQATAVGGTVVYCTCTVAPEENEGVVDHVLENEPCSIVSFESPLPSEPGIQKWNPPESDAPSRE